MVGAAAPGVIDAHLHLWRIGANGCTWPPASLAALHRDFTLDDWRAELGVGAVDGVVLVQSQEEPADTAWLLSVAAADPAVRGVIGWCDLLALDAADAIAMLAPHPKLCGLRPMVQDRPADWYDQPALAPAWRAMAGAGLVLDALVRPAHLPSLARLAARHPDLRIVIDHGAKPVLADLTGWRADMATLASHANVHAKVSGLLTERLPDDPPAAIEPAVAGLCDLFGPDRLIWGSDWPVLRLAGDYRGWLDQARSLVPPDWHPAVFGGTARIVYGLAA